MAGEMNENAIRGGKIEGEATKRLAPRRKDSEVNNTSTFNTKAITVGQPKTAADEQQSYQMQESGTRQNFEKIQFTPIPVTYRELYQSLYNAHAIAPFHLKPLQPPYPKWYDANARCEYHAGIPRHSIENCTGFKKAVERLIKMGVVKFDNTPNTENPLPNHGNQGVITIGEASERRMKENVAGVRMPMKVIWEEMMKKGSSCEKQVCMLEDKQKGTSWPRIIISLLGNSEVGAQTEPKVIIHKPTPFPYKDSKRVSWSYDCSGTVPEEENIANTSKDVQVEGSHTWSGKQYDTVGVKEEPTKSKNVSAEKEKKAEVPVKEPVLNETYVTHDISVNKLDRLVNNISANNSIYFNDDEIPPGGRGSTKALHITTRYKGYTLPSFFVDNGSALNVLPLSTLNRLPIDGSHMNTCQNMVRAFNGTKRNVIGRIDIPLEIGPSIYEVVFLVMDIKPSYNCLLGRQWIHSVGAVPSSLYQKLKLVTDGRLVTINMEEDIIVAVTNKDPYVETNEESIKCSFRSLEFVNVTFILEGSEPPVPKIARATRMALQMMPDYKQWRKEVENCQEGRRARHNGREVEWELMTFPLISQAFISGGLLIEESHQINAIHNKGSEQGNLEGICPYEPGSSLNN
ncbi:uncharacterized protein LOC128290539 [Gossypium arboreum]|uniref:uncharacterized protein LOC128290539 n=1 Tax=Gossypium arboreum TaxID=29729 RepID=UPI0022F1998C|nr:uncharacterized protein LOC128290539 [Gossypium arboreum]